MESKDLDNLADKLLDTALSYYTSAEPRAGLEARVLAGIRAEGGRMAAREWSSWLALAAVAAILLVGAMMFTKRTSDITNTPSASRREVVAKTTPEGNIAIARSSLPVQMATPRKVKISRQPHHVGIDIAADPRLEQFPSPRPLSREEQLLLAYVRDTPPEQLAVAASEAARNADYLQIKDLEISPLEAGWFSPESSRKNY
jgi:hypothetical protein